MQSLKVGLPGHRAGGGGQRDKGILLYIYYKIVSQLYFKSFEKSVTSTNSRCILGQMLFSL